ncbi:glycosyltransferase [Pseudodesulfovibrio sediminis]|uniref:Glycosyl transferase n=1 Tax=Pseudodesulfovibrio sediminis TaxID=2810563 RepID=A0ABN6EQU5_9BACT|nr:glycosyltransferase [Pseudodesulfovibrio sediminis]BCS87842.1 glycosyl transferase [Pseudodesulfovibrio sediminis]
MRVLIAHNNFPAQFRHIAEFLGHRKDTQVVFATKTLRREWHIPGITKAVFTPAKADTEQVHPLARTVDVNIRDGAAMIKLCQELKRRGFIPDVILGHSGWGQTLFLRDVFPDAPLISYFEWYYNADSPETLFDGKPRSDLRLAQLRTRNTPILHDLVSCDMGITPTAWQREQFPQEFQSKITPIHDGINTKYFAPLPDGPLPISELNLPNTDLTGAKELVTYCSRGMEPYRGFPQFYESLPAILDARPDCHVLIVGEDRICYSPHPQEGQCQSYVELMKSKVDLDESRVHFTGPLPYGKYKQVLHASSAHVYLTWPFVLSWSMLEAMSCGCLLVASDTEPVREVIRDNENGLLVDFHSPENIAATTIDALKRQEELTPIRQNARQTILDTYCLTKCLPVHLNFLIQAATNGQENFVNL